MATKTQDVQLNIRAVDYSRKTTDQVVDSLKALNSAQATQIENAKKGVAAGADLEKSYNNIAGAIKALADQDKLIKSLDAQNDKLAIAKQRLEAARLVQDAYTAALAGAERITDKQSEKLERLGRAVAGAESKMQTAQDRVTSTTARLAALGIQSDKSAEAQEKIATTIGESVAVLSELRNAYATLDSAQLARNKRLAEEAQAEKQVAVDIAFANAQRQAEIDADAKLLAAQKAVEAERERELNVDRQFVQAQNDVTASIAREAAARQAQVAAIQAAAAAANAARSAAASTARPGATAPVSNVAGQIRDIGDPAAAAARNVNTLNQSIAALETSVAAINGPIANYRELLNQAQAAQAGLQRVAGNVDAYNRQITSLRAARAEYVAQRTALNQLVAALQAGTGGDNILAQIQRQQGALRGAAQGLADVTVSARAARDALAAAGVNTANMAAAEAQLVSQSQRGAAAVSQLTAAYNQHGEAVNRSTTAMGGWFGGGRTTLSYAQRIRGELLGLAAAFVGVNAALEEGKDALETYGKFQALNARLLVAAGGNAKQAADDYAYLAQQSNRFGFVLLDIGNAYAKFAIAGKAANFTTQETRYVFEQFATAAKNARLSTAEFEGILKAVEQMMSKGTIQAEELRGQLGDRLPGAFSIAAKAAGKTTAEYAKMLELGEVSSARVIEIARGVGEAYGVIGSGAETLTQAQARFTNASDLFKKAIAENGFVDAYQQFLTKLTTIISGDNGDKLAKALGSAFQTAVDIMIVLIDNFDSLKTVLELVIGLKIAGWALNAATALRALGVAQAFLNTQLYATMGTGIVQFLTALGIGAGGAAAGVGFLEVALIAARVAVRALLASVPFLFAAMLAFEGLKFAWEKFFDKDEAKKAGEEAGKAGAQGLASGAATARPPTRDLSFEVLEKNQGKVQTMIEKAEADLLEARKAGAKKDLNARLGFIDQTFTVERNAAKKLYTDKQALEVALQQIQYASNIAQQAERQRYLNEQSTSEESAGKKRKRLYEEIAQDFKTAQDDIDKRAGEADPTKSFAERTAANQKAIEDAYNKTRNKIRELSKVDPAAAKGDTAQLNNLIEQRKEVQKRVDAAAEVARLDKQITNEMAIQKAQIDAIKARGAAGELTPEEMVQQINAAVSATAPKIQALGQKTMEFAASVKDLLTPTELAQALSKGTLAIAQNNSDAIQSANNLAAAETALNVILSQRQQELEGIQALEKARVIDDVESAKRQDAAYAAYKQKILDAANAVSQLVEVTRALGGAAPEALDKAAASMSKLTLETNTQIATTTKLGDTLANSLVNQGVTAVDAMGTALGKVVLGQESITQGFKDAGTAAAMFFAGLLKDIAAAIAKQLILNALLQAAGSDSSTGASLIKLGAQAATMHTGGIVGGVQSMSKSVSPAVFMGAPRFHDGGFPGLRSDEVPTILQKGEQVLARNDPNNVLNKQGGAGGGGGDSSTKFVLVDERSSVPAAMQSTAGEKVIMMALKTNIPTLRQWLKK